MNLYIHNGRSLWHGFGMMGGVSAFISIIFLVVAGLVIYTVVKSIGRAGRNAASPVLAVSAQMISKRVHMQNEYAKYYATFQFESGDRMEFGINGPEYGHLAEGDFGRLTFQGMRYMGFERYPNAPANGQY